MSGLNDFDFFIGKWRVHHRRLKERLAHNDDWEQFEGTSTVQKILGDLGNMDENVIELPSGTYRAATIRTCDPVKQTWTIWWIDSRNPGHLDPPVARFTPTISSKENRFVFAICGMRQRRRIGSRRSPMTEEKLGKLIGKWISQGSNER